MDKNKLVLPISILLGCIIIGGFIYASQVIKQQSIEKQQQIELQAKTEQSPEKQQDANENSNTNIQIDNSKLSPVEQKPAPKSVNINNNVEDSSIKIEKCKAEAKILTDGQEYVSIDEINDASLKTCGENPTKSCTDTLFEYLNDLSDTRKVNAYNQAYINCLLR